VGGWFGLVMDGVMELGVFAHQDLSGEVYESHDMGGMITCACMGVGVCISDSLTVWFFILRRITNDIECLKYS